MGSSLPTVASIEVLRLRYEIAFFGLFFGRFATVF